MQIVILAVFVLTMIIFFGYFSVTRRIFRVKPPTNPLEAWQHLYSGFGATDIREALDRSIQLISGTSDSEIADQRAVLYMSYTMLIGNYPREVLLEQHSNVVIIRDRKDALHVSGLHGPPNVSDADFAEFYARMRKAVSEIRTATSRESRILHGWTLANLYVAHHRVMGNLPSDAIR